MPDSDRARLLSTLQVEIDDVLLTRALTHRSYAYEHGGLPTNERLEFLGDSVLGFVVSDYLFRSFPDIQEDELSRRRAALVSTVALAGRATDLGVGEFLLLGRGEQLTGGDRKASLLADVMEALIGATYLSAGFDAASALVMRIVEPLLPRVAQLSAQMDPKTSLQELAQSRGLGQVSYQVTAEGPDHDRRYHAVVTAGAVTGSGDGTTKKHAEAAAALDAWHALMSPDA